MIKLVNLVLLSIIFSVTGCFAADESQEENSSLREFKDCSECPEMVVCAAYRPVGEINSDHEIGDVSASIDCNFNEIGVRTTKVLYLREVWVGQFLASD